MTTVHCGGGGQPLRWLADVAIHKFDPNYNMQTGTPIGLKFEDGSRDGTIIPFENCHQTVADALQDENHLHVYFLEDRVEAGK